MVNAKLEKLGFLVHENSCSSKQVQENIVSRNSMLFVTLLNIGMNIETNSGRAELNAFFSDSIITT